MRVMIVVSKKERVQLSRGFYTRELSFRREVRTAVRLAG